MNNMTWMCFFFLAGDHLRVVRGVTKEFPHGLYDHHMLVVEAPWSEHDESDIVKVIHYTAATTKAPGAEGEVIEQCVEFDVEEVKLEILTYQDGVAVNSPEIAIDIARRRKGEKNYGLFSNNCECFVNYCLINEGVSTQAGRGPVFAAVGGVLQAGQAWLGGGSLRDIADQAIEGVEKGYNVHRVTRH